MTSPFQPHPDDSTDARASASDPESIRAQAESLLWYHSIDLGHGVVTPGISTANQLEPAQLPDLSGRSVLDIGAWDGYYSFLAERLGASRVLALDHYVWGVDIQARQRYWDECAAAGEFPDQSKDLTEFWRSDLPGKSAFDFAHETLRSNVESVVGDFATMDLAKLGQFDVTLFLGVLYHLKDPLSVLERVRAVTRHAAVVETVAFHIHGLDNASYLQFLAGQSFQTDFGNWYMPTIEALSQMCLVAGFGRTSIVVGPPPRPAPASQPPRRRLPFKPAAPPSPGLEVSTYRAVVHAYV